MRSRTQVPQSPPQTLLQRPFSHLPGTVSADTTGADTIGADMIGADAVGADGVGAATIGAATTGEATLGADMFSSSGESACAVLDTRCRCGNAVWLKRRRYVGVLLN